LQRFYSMHGVGVEVVTDDPSVLEAMGLRFRCFAGAESPAAGPSIRFEFVSVAPDTPVSDEGRPVYETQHGALLYFPERDLLAGQLGGVRLHCEPARGRALIAAPAFRGSSLYFATHPLVTVALMELMERFGRFSLHAASLAEPNGTGLLISGPSGAGKSTLTLALARAGMGVLGDDLVFLQRTDDGPVRALGFADVLGIGAFAAGRFPELAPLMNQAPAEGFPKRLHRAEVLFNGDPVESCVPRVIAFPEVSPDLPSQVYELDAGAALLRLVPDVLLTHDASTRNHVEMIAALLGQVRCYTVRSGHDLECAAEMIREIISA
jgi:energy-coupling factor transporter ATP-binding protein EcfA2